MTTVLVTGDSGFLGPLVLHEAARRGARCVGFSRCRELPGVAWEHRAADLMDTDALVSLVEAVRPDVVVHMAGQSHVGYSRQAPAETLRMNGCGTISLLEALGRAAGRPRFVLASSSEVYAHLGTPIPETAGVEPVNAYGLSKLHAEQAAVTLGEHYGIPVCIARSFAHCGPGQEPRFAVSNFARQIAKAEQTQAARAVIRTGNGSTVRDYLDARDAARAYAELAMSNFAGVVNIGSGNGTSTRDLVGMLAAAALTEVEHQVDPALVRAGERERVVADVDLLRGLFGEPVRTQLSQSVSDALRWWRAELARDPGLGQGVFG